MKELPKYLAEKLNSAKGFELRKNYRAALREYRSILEEEKKLPEVWYKAGSVYSQISKSEKACTCFRHAIHHGYSKKLYYELGIEYFKLNDYEQSFDCMQKCIQHVPKFLPAFLMSAVIADRNSNTDQAIISIENLLKIDPGHKGAHSAMVILNLKKKDHKKSLSYLKKLESLGEDKHILQRLKARVLLEKGDIKNSIELLKTMSQENPDIQKFNSAMKEKLPFLKKKELLLKKETIEKKTEKDPSEWLNLSLLLFFEGDIKKAMDSLKKALKAPHL